MATTSARNGRGSRVPLLNTPPAPAPEPELSTVAQLTPTLDAAVLRVQALARPLIRNADGQIQNRTYSYVTLTAVTDEVLPLLVSEQLLWKAFPTVLANGAPGLRYRMTHVASGEFDEDAMPLLCDPTMQALGAAVTYARRYALTAYLNLTVDEDDDGAAANTPGRNGHVPTAEVDSQQPTARARQDTEKTASPSQCKMLWAKAKAASLSNVTFANLVKASLGQPESQSTDQAAAKRWLDANLEKKLPMRLVDDVVARIAHEAAEGSQA